jgi:GR25 family glycosyltransferase involved in LPS biosynthesis
MFDWSIFSKNAGVFCISLKEREDRYQKVKSELKTVGLEKYVTFYHPTRHPTSSVLGCHHSHITVLRMAQERKLDFVLVLEDDLVFDQSVLHQHLSKILLFLENNRRKADTWDILLLGHLPLSAGEEVYQLNDFSIRQVRSVMAHCYVANLHSPHIQKMLSEKLPEKDEYMPILGVSMLHIDYLFSSRMPNYLAISPMLAYQNDSPSDNNWGAIIELFRPGSGSQHSIKILERVTRMFPVNNPKLLKSTVYAYGLHVVNKLLYCNPISKATNHVILQVNDYFYKSLVKPFLRSYQERHFILPPIIQDQPSPTPDLLIKA